MFDTSSPETTSTQIGLERLCNRQETRSGTRWLAVPRVRCHEGLAGPSYETQEPPGWRYHTQSDYALREMPRRVSRRAPLVGCYRSKRKRNAIMYDIVCPMPTKSSTIIQKLITLARIISVLSGILAVAACFTPFLIGKFSKLPILSWRACFIAFLAALDTCLCTFWVTMAGEVGISFAQYLLSVWLMESGAIVSGVFAFSGATRFSVVVSPKSAQSGILLGVHGSSTQRKTLTFT